VNGEALVRPAATAADATGSDPERGRADGSAGVETLERSLPPAYGAATLEALRATVRAEGIRLRIAGDSMAPRVPRGTVVTVRRARVFLPGDLAVCVRSDDRLVVHRVLGYRPGRPWTLLTQADAAEAPDPAVPLARVIGRATAPGQRAVTLGLRARSACGFLARAVAGALRRLS